MPAKTGKKAGAAKRRGNRSGGVVYVCTTRERRSAATRHSTSLPVRAAATEWTRQEERALARAARARADHQLAKAAAKFVKQMPAGRVPPGFVTLVGAVVERERSYRLAKPARRTR